MTKPFLQLDSVSKKIGKQHVVYPFNLTLDKGTALALCGANGAGKSTVIRMIAGILQPTTGTITLNGLVWNQQRKAYAQQLGYMPDDFQFGSALSAWETICFYASLRQIDKKRAREVIELVGLYDVRSKSVATFSKGMRQRLMFAQAMLAAPPLLLLDEPTNGLDPYWTSEFIKLVNELKAEGTTLIYSTHQMHVVEQCADEAIFLEEGKIVGQGAIQDYIERYGKIGFEGIFDDVVEGS